MCQIMCTPVIAQVILDALSARLKNRSVFSAFDVTTDTRDGTTDRIDHSDVREIVRQEFGKGNFPDDYNQEAISLDIPGQSVAIVYFPDDKSALDHPRALQPTTPATSSAPTASPQAAQSSSPKQGGNTKDGDDFICRVTAEGRINVPNALLKQVTTVHGGSYDVSIGSKTLYITPNAEGRVRISKADLGSGDTFRVSVFEDTISIEQE